MTITEKISHWFFWKKDYYRCELIYWLGGTPDSHKNTLNYKNIESVVANLLKENILNR